MWMRHKDKLELDVMALDTCSLLAGSFDAQQSHG
jgi:hypothetical protein